MEIKYTGNKTVKLLLKDKKIKVNFGDEINLTKKEYDLIADKELFRKKKKIKKEEK